MSLPDAKPLPGHEGGISGDARSDTFRKAIALARGDFVLQLCCGILLLAIVVAVTVPLWPIASPDEQNLRGALTPPFFLPGGSIEHPLGTDYLGRDEFARLAWGLRVSLVVGFGAVVVAAIVGGPVGIVATYKGGWVEEVVMRFFDILLAIPTLLMAIAVLAVVGASLPVLIVVLGLRSTVYYARTLRSRVVSVREEQYVKAARALGLSNTRIIIRHVLPNVVAPIIVLSTIYVGLMIIVESSLSFLGLTKVHVSLGFMVAENLDYIVTAWWTVLWPGLCIVVIVVAINVIGDFLRDVLDPRLGATPS